jgi:hypothetical protein
MRKFSLIGGAAAIGIAIGVTLWRDRAPTTPTTSAARLEAPAAGPAVAPPRAAAPSRAGDESPVPAENAVERPAEEIDDGDNHGHEQDEILPLEEPPPSRDAFGADPQSEAAALAEVRATLEALLNDPDPAVKEQASAVLATIAAQ